MKKKVYISIPIYLSKKINENEIVLPVSGSHVVAAGIGGKEKYYD